MPLADEQKQSDLDLILRAVGALSVGFGVVVVVALFGTVL